MSPAQLNQYQLLKVYLDYWITLNSWMITYNCQKEIVSFEQFKTNRDTVTDLGDDWLKNGFAIRMHKIEVMNAERWFNNNKQRLTT